MRKHTHEQMKGLYRQAFGGLNESVLEDIGNRFWAHADMHSERGHIEELLYKEGQRSVYLHIIRMMAE